MYSLFHVTADLVVYWQILRCCFGGEVLDANILNALKNFHAEGSLTVVLHRLPRMETV